jgi:hypothetical protein
MQEWYSPRDTAGSTLQEDPDIKIQLLLGEKTVNSAFREVIKMQAILLVPRLGKPIAPHSSRRHKTNYMLEL